MPFGGSVVIDTKNAVKVGAVVTAGYTLYLGVKWTVVAFLAPATGRHHLFWQVLRHR
jgi:hypothetical protein